jgi:hypothetical protein
MLLLDLTELPCVACGLCSHRAGPASFHQPMLPATVESFGAGGSTDTARSRLPKPKLQASPKRAWPWGCLPTAAALASRSKLPSPSWPSHIQGQLQASRRQQATVRNACNHVSGSAFQQKRGGTRSLKGQPGDTCCGGKGLSPCSCDVV